MLADPSSRARRCTASAARACLNACPVYRQTGGHAYGSIYSGPIGAILTPQLQSMEHSQSLPYASSLCGACYEVCPVKINIPEILIHLRRRIVEERRLAGRAAGDEGGGAGVLRAPAGCRRAQTRRPARAVAVRNATADLRAAGPLARLDEDPRPAGDAGAVVPAMVGGAKGQPA